MGAVAALSLVPVAGAGALTGAGTTETGTAGDAVQTNTGAAGGASGVGAKAMPRTIALPDGVRALDSGSVSVIPQGPCVAETEYEAAPAGSADNPGTGAYGDACRRLKFAMGPIQVGPGRNEAMFYPLVSPRPVEEGYIVRFTMNVVEATPDADVPRGPNDSVVDGPVHMHHAVMLSSAFDSDERFARFTRKYTFELPAAPIFASGEERTIGAFPKGYGMLVERDQGWTLEHMIMNLSTLPRSAFVTYDLDYVTKADAERLGIVQVKPIWLDVLRTPIHPESNDHYANPVFNVQKGFGHVDPQTGRRVCTFPKENCARYDPWGKVTPNQGATVDKAGNPINIPGKDYFVRDFNQGTLVTIGGHVHPGGIRDELSLVRNGVEKPIFQSDAVYWRTDKRGAAGGAVGSWDFAMTGSGAPLGWKVKVKTGDILRLNAVYDSEKASWYHGMGIMMAFVAQNDPHGAPGVDVFEDDVTIKPGSPIGARYPEGITPTCRPDLTSASKTLCLGGVVTRGPQDSHSGDSHGGGGHGAGGDSAGKHATGNEIPGQSAAPGPLVTEIGLQNFSFGVADHRTTGTAGIPRVKVGEKVNFLNLDTGARLWHTVTRCSEPCTGSGNPIADAGTGDPNDVMDFDSSEIGYGLFIDSAKSVVGFEPEPDEATVKDGILWEFTPDRTGTFTFYCRSHPWMRGAMQVVGKDAAAVTGAAPARFAPIGAAPVAARNDASAAPGAVSSRASAGLTSAGLTETSASRSGDRTRQAAEAAVAAATGRTVNGVPLADRSGSGGSGVAIAVVLGLLAIVAVASGALHRGPVPRTAHPSVGSQDPGRGSHPGSGEGGAAS